MNCIEDKIESGFHAKNSKLKQRGLSQLRITECLLKYGNYELDLLLATIIPVLINFQIGKLILNKSAMRDLESVEIIWHKQGELK